MAASLSWAHVSADRRRIVVYASKVAGLAGMHPYQDREQMRAEFVDRVFHEEVAKEVKPDAAAIIAALPEGDAKAAIERIIALSSGTAKGSECKIVEALDTLAPSLVAPEVREAIREVAFTTHGKVAEDGIRDATREALLAHGAPSNNIRVDPIFRTGASPWFVVGDTRVFLGGKTDGLRDDGKVYEFKARMRRFLGVPTYERVQLTAYLSMLGATNGALVESYMGERKEHEVAFEPAFWAEVTAEAQAFFSDLLIPPAPTPV